MTTRRAKRKSAPLHDWDLTPKQAVALQKQLAAQISIPPDETGKPAELPALVAGVDVSYSKLDPRCFAAVVVWDCAAKKVVETATASGTADFPYVPGLLSFREAPIALEAIGKLTCKPDVWMFDGQGVAHPRRFGIACHIGLWLNAPTVGCAKSRLCGEHDDPRPTRGTQRQLTLKGARIGAVLCTKDNCNPMFVSPGHLASHAFAIRLTLACDGGYRMPQPTRLADQETKRLRREAEAAD